MEKYSMQHQPRNWFFSLKKYLPLKWKLLFEDCKRHSSELSCETENTMLTPFGLYQKLKHQTSYLLHVDIILGSLFFSLFLPFSFLSEKIPKISQPKENQRNRRKSAFKFLKY